MMIKYPEYLGGTMLKILGRVLAIVLVGGLIAGGLYLLANSSAGSFLGSSHEREFRGEAGDGQGFQGNFAGGEGPQNRLGQKTAGEGSGLGRGFEDEGQERTYDWHLNLLGILKDLVVIGLITLIVLGVQKAFKALSHKKTSSIA
jgi:hypothetical protein